MYPDHAQRLTAVAGLLVGQGWRPIIAAKNVAAVPPREGVRVIQAPVWPADLGGAAWSGRSHLGAPQGNVFGESEALGPVLGAWRTLFDAFSPALVIADNAPGAVLAARGTAPCITLCDGAAPLLPPGELEQINAVLPPDRAIAGGDALRGDRELRFGLPRFCGAGGGEHAMPVGVAQTPLSPGLADGIHFHLSLEASQSDVLIAAIVSLAGSKSFWAPELPGDVRDLLNRAGVTIAQRAPGVKDLGGTASLIIHAGGPSLAQQVLYAGMAQVVLSTEPQMARIGQLLQNTGCGHHLPLNGLTLPALVDFCADQRHRSRMSTAARAEAERLRSLDLTDWPEALASALVQTGPDTRLT